MKNLVHLLVFFALSACEIHTTSSKNFDLAAVKTYIERANKTYGQRFFTDDSSFYAERYCKNAIVMPPGGNRVVSRDSIRRYYHNGGQNEQITILITTTDLYGNADLVIEEGNYDFPDGKGGSFDKGKFIALWQQEDGKWKLFREIWNTDVLPNKEIEQ